MSAPSHDQVGEGRDRQHEHDGQDDDEGDALAPGVNEASEGASGA